MSNIFSGPWKNCGCQGTRANWSRSLAKEYTCLGAYLLTFSSTLEGFALAGTAATITAEILVSKHCFLVVNSATVNRSKGHVKTFLRC